MEYSTPPLSTLLIAHSGYTASTPISINCSTPEQHGVRRAAKISQASTQHETANANGRAPGHTKTERRRARKKRTLCKRQINSLITCRYFPCVVLNRHRNEPVRFVSLSNPSHHLPPYLAPTEDRLLPTLCKQTDWRHIHTYGVQQLFVSECVDRAATRDNAKTVCREGRRQQGGVQC